MIDWTDSLLLLYSFVVYSGTLLFDLSGLSPTDSANYAGVSSFYSPGNYLAWYLVATSILIKGPSGEGNNRWKIGGDLIGVFYYVGAAFVSSIVQISKQKDAELEAGLTVLETAADFSVVHVFTSTTQTYMRVLALGLFALSILYHNVSSVPILRTSTAQNLTTSGFGMTALITLLVMTLGTAVWKSMPPGIAVRRLCIAMFLLGLWCGNGMGTYTAMPRTGVSAASLDQLLVLDQLAPLGGAILAVLWSWMPDLRGSRVWQRATSWRRNRFV
jgi:hypothetical protein